MANELLKSQHNHISNENMIQMPKEIWLIRQDSRNKIIIFECDTKFVFPLIYKYKYAHIIDR